MDKKSKIIMIVCKIIILVAIGIVTAYTLINGIN